MRIAIIAALPGELKPLVRGWERHASGVNGLSLWRTVYEGDELIAVAGGMGANAAMRSFAAAEYFGALGLVLCVGWAGALDSGLRTGECYIASEIIDVKTGERYQLAEGSRKLPLVTSTHVVSSAEKRRLWQTYGAELVDMEAATVARLATMRNIPLCCFKGVSDGPDARLPDMNPFIGADGHMKMRAFLAHVALRPRHWRPLIKLGRHSRHAAEAIADKIERFLLEKNVHRTNSTGVV